MSRSALPPHRHSLSRAGAGRLPGLNRFKEVLHAGFRAFSEFPARCLGGYLHGAPAEICTLISRAGRDGEGQTRLRSGRKWRRTQGAVRITFLVNVWFNHVRAWRWLNSCHVGAVWAYTLQ